MSDESVTCSFVFTAAEHRNAQFCYWSPRLILSWVLPFVAVVLLVLGNAWISSSSPEPAPEPAPANTSLVWALFINFLPVFIFVGLMIYLLRFQFRSGFRKGGFVNRQLTYILNDSGFRLDSPLMQADIKWELIGRVMENKNGFLAMILGSRSFHWLPKSGFSSPKEVNACRKLFRQYVKDSRRLFAD
jgi:hypothetical protein